MACAKTWSACALALLLVMPSLSGCASPPTSSPQPPVVDSILMENYSPKVEDFSQRVEDWLKRAADYLERLPRKPLGCKPKSASCA